MFKLEPLEIEHRFICNISVDFSMVVCREFNDVRSSHRGNGNLSGDSSGDYRSVDVWGSHMESWVLRKFWFIG